MVTLTRNLLVLLLLPTLGGCPDDQAFVLADNLDTDRPTEQDTTDVASGFSDTDTSVGQDVRGPLNLICESPPSTGLPFPSNEAGVRITSPTGTGTVLYAGATVTLAGIAVGDLTSLKWKSETDEGLIPIAAYWSAPGIALKPGDNSITVVAIGVDGVERSDSIVITSRPAAALLGDVRVSAYPSSILRDEPTRVQLSVKLELGSVDPDQITLSRVTPEGVGISPPESTKLRDDGQNIGDDRCDAVPGDRVFSACKVVKAQQNETYCYRAFIGGLAGDQVAESPVTCIDLATRITATQCFEVTQVLKQAQSAYAEENSHTEGIEAALSEITASSAALGLSKAGKAIGGYGIWLQFETGLLAAVPLGVPPGYRSRPDSRKAVIHAPIPTLEQNQISSRLTEDTCPPWSSDVPLEGAEATTDTLRQMSDLGILAFTGHGGAFFDGSVPGATHNGAQEVLWTGENVDCAQLPATSSLCTSDSDCPMGGDCILLGSDTGQCRNATQVDLGLARLTMSPTVYGILPSFVDEYSQGKLPNSLVWASACHSAFNGSLAMSFLAGGAASYVGYSGLVRDEFATEVASRAFEGLISNGDTAGDAVCFTEDPATAGNRVRLFGSTATSLDTSGIINAGFENPDGAGWITDGNARQVGSFCGVLPEFGAVMALINTALGGAGLTGSFTQTFCIPAGTNNLTFWWRYLTSEPEVICGGDKYADRWRVSLTRRDGTRVEIKSCTRDDMCEYDVGLCQPKPCGPPSDCGCGACYQPVTLVEDCDFDGQPVTSTSFIKETFNVSSFAGGGPVTLEVDLLGDSLNASSLLIDEIQFQ
jgi:hypothetical protein